jgi:hypothetical protein
MIQEWWNAFVQWFNSTDGRAIFTGTIMPFVAILAAGIIAAAVARGSTKRLIAQQNRQYKASAVAALISAGQRTAIWSALPEPEREHLDRQYSEAEVRVRLLPMAGAGLAADWSAHETSVMKKNSVNYTFQGEQDVKAYQDGLIAWQKRPSRAKKLFAQDLATWQFDDSAADEQLVTKQREWAAEQSATTTPLPKAAADVKKS